MSANINGVPVIFREPEGQCELCGVKAETRPYGPKGEEICFDCGQKDKATTERQMARVLFGKEMQ